MSGTPMRGETAGRLFPRLALQPAGSRHDRLALHLPGLYPDSPKVPCVVGYEVACEVESVGDGVESVKPGERVLA